MLLAHGVMRIIITLPRAARASIGSGPNRSRYLWPSYLVVLEDISIPMGQQQQQQQQQTILFSLFIPFMEKTINDYDKSKPNTIQPTSYISTIISHPSRNDL